MIIMQGLSPFPGGGYNKERNKYQMAVISGCSEKCDGNSLGNGERPYNNHKK
jgi:hypothetical protein